MTLIKIRQFVKFLHNMALCLKINIFTNVVQLATIVFYAIRHDEVGSMQLQIVCHDLVENFLGDRYAGGLVFNNHLRMKLSVV